MIFLCETSVGQFDFYIYPCCLLYTVHANCYLDGASIHSASSQAALLLGKIDVRGSISLVEDSNKIFEKLPHHSCVFIYFTTILLLYFVAVNTESNFSL